VCGAGTPDAGGRLTPGQLSVAAGLLDHMDSEKYLARLDSLCTEDLSGMVHSESAVLMAGPGYRIVPLEVSHGTLTGDASQRLDTVEDFHALKEHIARVLNDRWAEHRPPWGMGTLRVRLDRGEEIPEPWAVMSVLVDELNLWQRGGVDGREGSDRWIALGIADRDETDEISLLAVASDIAPA
jgi:hypothetical protein